MYPIAFNKIGGYGNLERVYSIAVPSKIIPNSTCHLPRQDAMHLFRDAVTGDLPWPGMTLGLTILATWYWCTDQVYLKYTRRTHECTCIRFGKVFRHAFNFPSVYAQLPGTIESKGVL